MMIAGRNAGFRLAKPLASTGIHPGEWAARQSARECFLRNLFHPDQNKSGITGLDYPTIVGKWLARDAASATTAILPDNLQAHGGSSNHAELTRSPRLLAVHFVSPPPYGCGEGHLKLYELAE
jgi:hypothetical protein